MYAYSHEPNAGSRNCEGTAINLFAIRLDCVGANPGVGVFTQAEEHCRARSLWFVLPSAVQASLSALPQHSTFQRSSRPAFALGIDAKYVRMPGY